MVLGCRTWWQSMLSNLPVAVLCKCYHLLGTLLGILMFLAHKYWGPDTQHPYIQGETRTDSNLQLLCNARDMVCCCNAWWQSMMSNLPVAVLCICYHLLGTLLGILMFLAHKYWAPDTQHPYSQVEARTHMNLQLLHCNARDMVRCCNAWWEGMMSNLPVAVLCICYHLLGT
jgi:hypothetical protein